MAKEVNVINQAIGKEKKSNKEADVSELVEKREGVTKALEN